MIKCLDLGLKPYLSVLELQEKLQLSRINKEIEDTLIFCEHTPVFTVGKRECDDDWLSEEEDVKLDGIEVIKTNRGGRITYHGPGQLVVYFIFDISKYGVKEFVRMVEELTISAIKEFGVELKRDPLHPGLWFNDKKVVAVGFHISKLVSMHGIAINVNPEMNHFRHIIPCGIADKGVTSLKEITGKAPQLDDLKKAIKKSAAEIFNQQINC